MAGLCKPAAAAPRDIKMALFLLVSSVSVGLVQSSRSSFDVGVWRDAPMSSSTLQYLDSSTEYWRVSALDGSVVNIPATVPGDTITDLANAGILGDPIYELNFLDGRWDTTSWNYSVAFTLAPGLSQSLTLGASAAVSLVLESVKLVGDVYLNGEYLGTVADQFLRYSFPVQALLSPAGSNALSIVISNSSDPRFTAEGRITGAGGGWDWGPIRVIDYRENRVVQYAPDDASMSRGLVRSLYLLQTSSGSLVINQTVPLVFYRGPYPTAPLTDDTAGPFLVSVAVYLSNPNPAPLLNVPVTVQGSWGGGSNSTILPSLPVGDSTVTLLLTVPAGMTQLWWTADTTPASRRGSPQPLYTVTVTVSPPGALPLTDTRKVGFKVFTLVTGDDTNPQAIAGLDGSGNLTTRFKLNGANIFSRGADVIPMEWLEGRQSSPAYVRMLTSSVEGGFNTIRVDGIDAYFPDIFYDTCDQLGLLLYHDLQYSQSQPNPVATPMQDAELRYQVRRLAPHASMAVWDGCNECGGHGIYASFLMTVVAQEDPSHPPWPASPSPGWNSGVDRLTSLPNGSPLGLQPRETPPARGGDVMNAATAHARMETIACASGPNCTAQVNVDYCNTCLNAPHPSANSSEACCDACTQAGAAVCWAAVFYEGTCWFKAQPNTTTPLYAPGRIAVWPAGHGPIPPLPPPGPEPPGDRETHGPYMHGNGFPAVDVVDGVATPALPPILFPSYQIGVNASGTYASEFGCVAFSSFESMAATLAPQHWSMHGGSPADTCTPISFFNNCTGGNAMAQRNYPMDNIVSAYFGAQAVGADDVGVDAFARHTWMSITAQALHLASDIQTRRSHNTWGTLVWQLNEIWPTGGWGSIEYGVQDGFTPGQMSGGRWKPLHHWMARHLYKDLLLVCGDDGRCFLKNDDALSARLSLTAQRSLLRVTDGQVVATYNTSLSLPIGAGSIAWFCLDNSPFGSGGYSCNSTASVLSAAGCKNDGSDCVLSLLVQDGTPGAVVQNAHSQLLAPPFSVGPSLPFKGNLTITIDPVPYRDGSLGVYVSFDPLVPAGGSRVALLVTLTATVPGRFNDNAFTLVEPTSPAAASCPDPTALCSARVAGQYQGGAGSTPPTLYFYPWSDDSSSAAGSRGFGQADVRVQHLAQYYP